MQIHIVQYLPFIFIFSAVISLLLAKNHNKLFNFIAMSYPVVAFFFFYRTNMIWHQEIFDLEYIFDLTGNNRLIILAFSIATMIANFYGYSQNRKNEIIIGGCYFGFSCICLVAGDYLTMFCGLELMMIAAAMLVLIENVKAGVRYVTLHLFSGSLVLAGIAQIFAVTGSIKIMPLVEVATDVINYDLLPAIVMFLAAFLINAGCGFVNSWMIMSYPAASSTGFIYLITFTTKVTIMLMLKIFSGFDMLKFAGLFMVAYGGLYACLENNLRRSFCYLTISQLGLMLIGIGVGTVSADRAVTLYMVAHIIYSAPVAIVIGVLEEGAGVSKCSEIGKIQVLTAENSLARWWLNLGVKLALIIAILVLVNFPFTLSFMAKLPLMHVIAFDFVQYILNAIVFVALPIRGYFSKRSNNITELNPVYARLLLVVPLVLITFSIVIFVNYHLMTPQDFDLFSASGKIGKQLAIMLIGVVLTMIVRIKRYQTSSFNPDLLVIAAGLLLNFYKIISRTSNFIFKKLAGFLLDVATIFTTVSKKIKVLDNQATSIALVFIVLIIYFLNFKI